MLVINTLRVLCFGDSLTEGFSGLGAVDHPYGLALKASLEKGFPQINQIVTDIQGLGGDMAISPPGYFLRRMTTLCQ